MWPGAASEYVLYAVFVTCCGVRRQLAALTGLRCSDKLYFELTEGKTTGLSGRLLKGNLGAPVIKKRVC